MTKPRQTYIVPGVVDGAVAKAQAERRRDHRGETTIVHAHRYDPDRNLCSLDCMVFKPGFKMGSVATELVPLEEGDDAAQTS